MDGYTFHRVKAPSRLKVGYPTATHLWVCTPTPEDSDTWDLIHDHESFMKVILEDQEARAALEHPDLVGIVCSCGSKGPFRMGLTAMCTVYSDGHIDDVDTPSLDDLAYPEKVACVCNACNRIATLEEFLPTRGGDNA